MRFFLLSQSDEEFFIFTCLYKPILYFINIVLLFTFILDILWSIILSRLLCFAIFLIYFFVYFILILIDEFPSPLLTLPPKFNVGKWKETDLRNASHPYVEQGGIES